jgi:hypothetical protein
MKKLIISGLIMATTCTGANALDITLSKSINSGLRAKIERDLKVVENFNFADSSNAFTLSTLGLEKLDAQSASVWLNDRVKYIVSENATSLFNLLFKRAVYVERTGVLFPNATIIPYSLDESSETSLEKNLLQAGNRVESKQTFVVMLNIGTGLYYGGKQSSSVLGMKVSKGFFKKAERVNVESPRTGIIQIGEGLFSPQLTINSKKPDAIANSIFRLGTLFHEARHSDGNGESLGFLHITCPKGHTYEGQAACDENLNGPYMVGALMLAEMTRSCGENCTEKETETLKVMIADSLSRVLQTTHKGEASKVWDATPESL